MFRKGNKFAGSAEDTMRKIFRGISAPLKTLITMVDKTDQEKSGSVMKVAE